MPCGDREVQEVNRRSGLVQLIAEARAEQEAKKDNVFPLNNETFARATAPRPSAAAGRMEFSYTGVNSGIPNANAPNIIAKSYTITADIEAPQGGVG